LSELLLKGAQEIAETAAQFGQEDDITVLSLAIDR
jgi:serine phosphatase RsbU (regulator of sigma subunit)